MDTRTHRILKVPPPNYPEQAIRDPTSAPRFRQTGLIRSDLAQSRQPARQPQTAPNLYQASTELLFGLRSPHFGPIQSDSLGFTRHANPPNSLQRPRSFTRIRGLLSGFRSPVSALATSSLSNLVRFGWIQSDLPSRANRRKTPNHLQSLRKASNTFSAIWSDSVGFGRIYPVAANPPHTLKPPPVLPMRLGVTFRSSVSSLATSSLHNSVRFSPIHSDLPCSRHHQPALQSPRSFTEHPRGSFPVSRLRSRHSNLRILVRSSRIHSLRTHPTGQPQTAPDPSPRTHGAPFRSPVSSHSQTWLISSNGILVATNSAQ
jgi:hypothetical protein